MKSPQDYVAEFFKDFPWLKHSKECKGRRHYSGVHPFKCDCGIQDENTAQVEAITVALTKALTSYCEEQRQEGANEVWRVVEREREEALFHVGYDKNGEIDFGVRASIASLPYKKYQAFREMVVVAIGSMEGMWRRQQETNQGAASQDKATRKPL